jgi:hypothetical protein
VLRTQFATTVPLEITGLYENQFGTGGGMSRTNAYDLVIIGGGIAGSSLACSMAKAGARVLLLESEIEVRDRVRGEILCPWGVADLCLRTKSLLYHHSNRDRLASRVFPRHRSFCRRSPRSRPAAHWSRQDPHPGFGFQRPPMPLWPQTLEPACSARMSLRPDPRCCPLLELFLERGELLPQCFQLSS